MTETTTNAGDDVTRGACQAELPADREQRRAALRRAMARCQLVEEPPATLPIRTRGRVPTMLYPSPL
jgi:hypothetical protein